MSGTQAISFLSLAILSCLGLPSTSANWSGSIEEFHFHVYWFQNNPSQISQAVKIRQMVIDNVRANNFTAVCNGVTKEILPNLDEANVPHFNKEPIGPHPCGSYEIWVPREYLPHLMSFFMLNRGDLSVLLHPLGGAIGMSSYEGHTTHAMWLGPSFRINLDVLSKKNGDPPQYPGLRLGYSSPGK
jgi:DOPA 4,5-dioxygenase